MELLLLVLRRVGAMAGDFVAQRIVRSPQGDISHAVVEQVFRAQLCVHMHQHTFGSLPCGVTIDGRAVSCSKVAAANFPVVSGAWTLPIRAWVTM